MVQKIEILQKQSMLFLGLKDKNNKQQAKLVEVKEYNAYKFYKGEY